MTLFQHFNILTKVLSEYALKYLEALGSFT